MGRAALAPADADPVGTGLGRPQTAAEPSEDATEDSPIDGGWVATERVDVDWADGALTGPGEPDAESTEAEPIGDAATEAEAAEDGPAEADAPDAAPGGSDWVAAALADPEPFDADLVGADPVLRGPGGDREDPEPARQPHHSVPVSGHDL